MALFGSRRQALGIVPFMDEEPAYGAQKMPAAFNGPPAKRARRGLFGGGVSRLLGNDGNPATPNLWDWIALGPQAPDILQDRQQRQQLFGARMSATKREEEEALRQQAAREAAYAALPEQLRPLGPILTPEAISRAVMPPPPEPPDWDLDPVTGQPYTVTPQGRVQYGEGRVNVRPAGGSDERGPSLLPGALASYQFTEGGSLAPIRGSPADREQRDAAEVRVNRLAASELQLGNAVRSLNSVLGLPRETMDERVTGAGGQISRDTTGVWANRFRQWGLNQRGTDLHEALEPVRAITAFETLAEMRRNSETGGALGQVAVREIELLMATYGSLDTAQSPEQLRRTVVDIRAQLIRTQRAVAAARQEAEQRARGGAGSQPDAAPQRPPNVPAEARWDAQRQRWVAD